MYSDRDSNDDSSISRTGRYINGELETNGFPPDEDLCQPERCPYVYKDR